jgi:hypothetical protein
MMAYYRPQAPLQKALRKISCRMVFLYQTSYVPFSTQVSHFPVPIFGVNITSMFPSQHYLSESGTSLLCLWFWSEAHEF